MNKIVKNPTLKEKAEIIIKEDSSLGYFLHDEKILPAGKINLHLILEKGTKLTLTLVDYLNASLDFEVQADLKEGSVLYLNLASLCFKDNMKIFRFDVNHNEGSTYSRTKMNGVNLSNGTLKFLGSSFIKNGAHKSDTRQEGRITNLSLAAKSEVSPALLIKDNDVKASHGAALGAYNPTELYYLMSRGLSLEESKKLITYGSLLPIIESLKDENLVTEAKEVLGGLKI
jgi:Fe-S cluster assembly protein SufD